MRELTTRGLYQVVTWLIYAGHTFAGLARPFGCGMRLKEALKPSNCRRYCDAGTFRAVTFLHCFVAGLTLCCTTTHHQPESPCAAPQLLIALSGRSSDSSLPCYAVVFRKDPSLRRNAITVAHSLLCFTALRRVLPSFRPVKTSGLLMR